MRKAHSRICSSCSGMQDSDALAISIVGRSVIPPSPEQSASSPRNMAKSMGERGDERVARRSEAGIRSSVPFSILATRSVHAAREALCQSPHKQLGEEEHESPPAISLSVL